MKFRVTQYQADGEVVVIKTFADASLVFVAFSLAVPGMMDARTTKFLVEEIQPIQTPTGAEP